MAIKDGDKLPATMVTPSINNHYAPTDGVVIGVRTIGKVAFHGANPVAQRSGSAQAAVASSTNATLVDVPTASYTATEQTAIQNCINAINAMKVVVDAEKTLLNEIRAALVEKGLIKGSA